MNNNNAELYHYGVKGMKWGVRRYQNKDGSLTAAGKKRLKRGNAQLDRINEAIFKDRLFARNAQVNDPASVMTLQVLSKRVKEQADRGEQIVNNLKKKGLLSPDTKFADYTEKYERKVINDCKRYVSEKYDLKDVSDDDVNYFLEAYLCGAI